MTSALLLLALLSGQHIKIAGGPEPWSPPILIFTNPRIDVYARNEPDSKVIRGIAKQANYRVAQVTESKSQPMSLAYINAPMGTILAKHFIPSKVGRMIELRPPYIIVDDFVRSPKRVSFDVRDQDVRDVLRNWAKQGDLSYTVDTRITGKVTLTVKDADMYVTLRDILNQVDALYHLEGGIVNVYAQQGDGPDLDQMVPSFRCQEESLFSALKRLAHRYGVAIEAANDVDLLRRVSVDVGRKPLHAVLVELLGKDIVAEPKGWRIFLINRS